MAQWLAPKAAGLCGLGFLAGMGGRFDVCVIDTSPYPDVRYLAALAATDFVLSPLQLNQEAIDGVGLLLNHPEVGLRRIKVALNPNLRFIGLLPVMIEATPFQKANLIEIVQRYSSLLISLSDAPGDVARIWKRSAVAEAQAAGEQLWEMKKTAARDAWKEIEPCLTKIAGVVLGEASVEVARAV
jgi:chromosome partitioning protein